MATFLKIRAAHARPPRCAPFAARSVPIACLVLAMVFSAGGPTLRAWQEPPADRALVIVGLPGDEAHEAKFAEMTLQIRDWLVGPMQFGADGVEVLFGQGIQGKLQATDATREAIQERVRGIRNALTAESRCWVFYLGHASHDGMHAWLHLPGPDLNSEQFAELFRDLPGREQVFWMTSSASGGFLPSLRDERRIVITACAADGEFNETEFPRALARMASRTVQELDQNGDERVSLLELLRRTVEEVESLYVANDRIVTEHAQLDDTSDGKGSESPWSESIQEPGEAEVPNKAQASKPNRDGARSAALILPLATTPAP